MDKQSITIYDVAREAGVSMATVSRVVNGNPNVKDATRQKVLDVIERLDYRPNAVARGLASKKTTTVGVIIPDVTNVYFSSLARGIDDVAAMYKYNIILANSDESYQKEIHVLNTLLAKQVDGIIYLGHTLSDEMRQAFMRSRTPVILAGSIDPTGQVGSVNINYIEATRAATAQLIRNGNTRIALVTGGLKQPINSQYRLKGYQQALNSAGIPYDESLVFETEYSYDAGLKVWDRVKVANAAAAMVGDDELAVGILDGALDDGIKIPTDFELITSNNTKLTKMVRPQLTSISQPLYDIGAVAMRLLTKVMNKEEVTDNTILLPYGIINRGSTKNIK